MATISLCMIVKNEEASLKECLSSVKDLVDEIIIVDTGSTDKTKEIAKMFTNKVFDFKWVDDFAKARNYGIKKAKMDYVMWLDGDDFVPKDTLKYLLNLKKEMTDDMYMIKYDLVTKDSNYNFSFYRERIIKNTPNCRFVGAVHECINVFGKTTYLPLSIEHRKTEKEGKSDRNLNIFKKTKAKRKLTTRELYYFGRELFDHRQYDECISTLKKFLKRKDFWVENAIDANYTIAKCYLAKNEINQELNCLFETFKYDSPRANVCVLLGDNFFYKKDYNTAIFWYNQATKCEDVSNKGAFVDNRFYGYIPNIQMCVCYYYLNDYEKSYIYNEKASEYLESKEVKSNRELLIKLLNK